MTKCLRCEFVFDETRRSTCPICFTPVQAQAAPPQAPPATFTTQPLPPAAGAAPVHMPQPASTPPQSSPQQNPPPLASQAPPLPAQPGYGHVPPAHPQTLPAGRTPMPLTGPSEPSYLQAPPPTSGAGIPGLPEPTLQSYPPTGAIPPNLGFSTPHVSLTGEVVPPEAPPLSPTPPLQPTGYVPGGPGPQTTLPMRPTVPAAYSPLMMARKRETPRSTSPLGTVISAILLALIAVGGVTSYARSGGALAQASFAATASPAVSGEIQAQAQKYLTALTQMDWKALYETSEIDTNEYPTAEDFANKMNAKIQQNPQAVDLMNRLSEMMRFEVGEPSIDGDEATVPVKTTFSIEGRSETTSKLKMKRIGGVWKVQKGAGFGGMNGEDSPFGGARFPSNGDS